MILPFSDKSIQQGAEVLRSGDLVAFPTETVYGLGANALNDDSVKKIFALKNRPASNPLIVHVPTCEKALELIDPNVDEKILTRFKMISSLWPGPLSLIVPKAKNISNLVSAGGETIAIRIPKHPVALALLSAVGLPIAAPSANKSFAVSPTTAQHVEESFSSQDLFILDGGPCHVGLESTVLDISSEISRILRPGAIDARQIMQTLDEACLCDLPPKPSSPEFKPLKSPGLFDLHYAPRTPLVFIGELSSVAKTLKLGVLLFSPKLKAQFEGNAKYVSILSQSGDLEEVARSLYKEIRALDQKELDLLAIETCPEQGIGAAIMDRLRRAKHLPK